MSNKEAENKEPQTKKVITKYDQKMQRRKEEKEKEKREQAMSTAIGIVIVIALACLVASFPIRSYLTVHGKYITINGESVTRVEFDYNYNLVQNNYITQYGSYLSYFGLDMTADLSTQMYSDTLTWKDYFEQLTVDTIIQNQALKDQADAAGFTCDTSEEYSNFETSVKTQAKEAGVTEKEYLTQLYGSYATMSRISGFVKEAILVNAYYTQLEEEKGPSEEEIDTYYQANTDDYDSVDYYVLNFDAELPTEPTELADPVEEAADTTADNTTDTTEADTTEETYTPSEAEVNKAMEDARELADAAEGSVASIGTLQENVTKTAAVTAVRDWLFDASRTEGNTTVIEDTTNNRYYVLSFVKRYRDETASANVRVLVTSTEDGQALLDEWKAGAATEDTFGELVASHSEDTTTAATGGLYENMTKSGMDAAIGDWLFDTARVAGDTTAVTAEDGYTYVMYFVGTGDPQWKLSIKNTLLNETMTAYLDEITADYQVSDSKGNLNYLAVEASVAASESAAAETAATETAETETAATETAETETAATTTAE